MKLEIFPTEILSEVNLPFADGGVHAGFPSPAQDYMDRSIDLNMELISHPESTFCARVVGNSMIDADVLDGDIIVIDRSVTANDGDMVVCILDGEFTVKYLHKEPNGVTLVPANKDFKEIQVAEGSNFEVWGVVTYVIHKAR